MEILKYVFLIDNKPDNHLFYNLERLDADYNSKKSFKFGFEDNGVICDVLVLTLNLIDAEFKIDIRIIELEDSKKQGKKSEGKYLGNPDELIASEIYNNLLIPMLKLRMDDRSLLLIQRLIELWSLPRKIVIESAFRNPFVKVEKQKDFEKIKIHDDLNTIPLNYARTCTLRKHVTILLNFLVGKKDLIHSVNTQIWVNQKSLLSEISSSEDKNCKSLIALFNSSINPDHKKVYYHNYIEYANEIKIKYKMDNLTIDSIVNLIALYNDVNKKIKKVITVKDNSSIEYLTEYYHTLDSMMPQKDIKL